MMLPIFTVLVSLLTACGKPNAPRLVLYGDSHTEGLSGLEGAPGYAVLLGERLGLPVHNRGIGSSKIAMAGQLVSMREDGGQRESEASVIVYLAGYNDMRFGRDPGLVHFRQDLREALELLVDRGAGRVLIGNCMRMRADEYAAPAHAPNFVFGSDAMVSEYNAVIEQEAARAGAEVVDVSSAIDPERDASFDRVHLSAEGHRRLADIFEKALGGNK